MEPGYAEALWKAHPHMNESADFVMYWWDRAAELLTRKKTALRRFGLVTTNSISQVFQRRVMERHLNAKVPVSIIFAVPDHPWTKASQHSAAVRIGMTVAVAGERDGSVGKIGSAEGLDSDEPVIEIQFTVGKVNADLTIGPDVTRSNALHQSDGLCSPGVKLHGAGFIVTPAQAKDLGLGRRVGLEKHIRPYANGRDLVGHSRNVMVIDLFGLSDEEVRRSFPEVYQHILEHVKPERDLNARPYRRNNWWLFGENNPKWRESVADLRRYIVTVETTKHRIFSMMDASFLPDNMLTVFSTEDAFHLSVVSSRVHQEWVYANSGLIGVAKFEQGHRYTKTRVFDPFPFPDPDESTRARLRALGEELDATRKTVQGEHPDLTLTGLYNVLEKVRAGTELTAAEADVKARGRVLILKDLHEQIDRATMQAYGWDDLIPLLSLSSSSGPRSGTGGPSGAREREPVVDSGVPEIVREQVAFGAAGSPGRFAPEDDEGKRGLDEIMLERLVALNAERAAEEAAGHVRWLRPDYQIPRFAKGAAAPRTGELDLGATVVAIDKGLPAFPKDKGEQVMAIRAVLQASSAPMDAAAVARAFKGGGRKIEQRVVQALNTLVRYTEITALADGRFAARRAA